MRSVPSGLFLALCTALLVLPSTSAADAQTTPVELGGGIPIAAASNAAGDQAVLFRDGEGPKIRFQSSDGGWSTAQPVPGDGSLLDVDIDGTGAVTVVWVNSDEAAAATWADGTWSDTVQIETPGAAGWSVVGVAPGAGGGLDVLDVNEAGAAVFTYLAGTSSAVKAARRQADGTWSPAQTVGSHSDLWGMASIDEAGVATVVWQQRNVPSTGEWLMASTSSEQVFGDAEVIAPAAGHISSAALSGNGAGDVAVGWVSESAGDNIVNIRTRRAGESFTAAETLARGAVGPISVAMSASGDVAAAWKQTSESTSRLRSSAVRAGGAWSEPQTLAEVDRYSDGDGVRNVVLTPAPTGRWLVVLAAQVDLDEELRALSWAPEDQAVARPALLRVSETTLGDPYGPVDFVLAHYPGSDAARVAWTELRITPYSQVMKTVQLGADDLPEEPLPTAELVDPSTRFTDGRAVTVSWTGTDRATFTVRRKTAAATGTWTAYKTWMTTTQRQATFRGRPGSTYCFTVTAANSVGESAPSTQRCVAVPIDDRALTATGRWSETEVDTAYQGTLMSSSTKGSQLHRDLRSNDTTIIAGTCPRCGDIAIYVDGAKARTASLRRQAGYLSITITRPVRHRLRVVVTSSGRPVRIDAIRSSRV